MVMLCTYTYSQGTDKNRNDYSPYNVDYSMLSFQMRQIAMHGDATQITYFDLNFVDGLMQHFMKNNLNMVIDNVSKFKKEGYYQTFTVSYAQMATIGTGKIPHVYFKYTIFDNKEKHPIIKSCIISGNASKVIYFYASYWPTTMNFDGSHDKVAFNYLLQDKATIRLNPANATWNITVENTTIKSIADYEKIVASTNLELLPIKPAIIEREAPESIESTKNRAMRNAIVNVAHDYGMSFNESISNDSLRALIFKRKQLLMNGDRYDNVSDTSFLMYDFLHKLLPIKAKDFIADMIIRLDKNGKIYKVEFLSEIPPVYKPVINKKLIGNPLKPYTNSPENSNSFKMYKIRKEDKAIYMREYELSNDNGIITINKKNEIGASL